jgi:hypothetical protein
MDAGLVVLGKVADPTQAFPDSVIADGRFLSGAVLPGDAVLSDEVGDVQVRMDGHELDLSQGKRQGVTPLGPGAVLLPGGGILAA